jgi:ubiquinone/menaquinone biosynthesis C-methylase UbiE
MSIRLADASIKAEVRVKQMEPSKPKLYTSFARYYDRLESQYRNYEEDSRWIDWTISQHGSMNVIDISCGTGSHIARLSQLNKGRFAVAMDSSKEMISIASKKSEKGSMEFGRADFLRLPIAKESFDSAICMYWSLAGLEEKIALKLFEEVHSILKSNGIFIFDVENSEGIKENLIDSPFIDSFFLEEDVKTAVIRANYSRKIAPDIVDWHSYYLIEEGGVSRLVEDRMNLRFYSREQLERLLSKSGFETLEVSS